MKRITINLDKAKVVAHAKRRMLRDEEMKPFDEIIAKQIPGTSFADAENSRKEIRKKYDKTQQDVDAATSIEDLSSCLKAATKLKKQSGGQ